MLRALVCFLVILTPFFVDGCIESGVDGQAGFGRGTDILRCIVERTQGLGSPIGGNRGEHSMFDGVPFARAWRVMTNGDRNIFSSANS
jgi:hypothetical protein